MACEHEDRGEGKYHCTKKLGTHGSENSYRCLWASNNMREAYTAEKEHHAEALKNLGVVFFEDRA